VCWRFDFVPGHQELPFIRADLLKDRRGEGAFEIAGLLFRIAPVLKGRKNRRRDAGATKTDISKDIVDFHYFSFRHFEKRGSLSALFSLRGAPNRLDRHLLPTHPVQHDIGSAADDQFPNAGFRSRVPQIWMISQSFDDGDDPDGQSLRRNRLVLGDVSADFLKPCTR